MSDKANQVKMTNDVWKVSAAAASGPAEEERGPWRPQLMDWKRFHPIYRITGFFPLASIC